MEGESLIDEAAPASCLTWLGRFFCGFDLVPYSGIMRMF